MDASWCEGAHPARQAKCVGSCRCGRGGEGENRVAGAAKAAGLHRRSIPTPDSSSRGAICPFGRKYGPLARICSGSLDRLVLGHLCTDRPQNTCNRIARARGCTIGQGDEEAAHGEGTWGTPAKQQRVSHARTGRALAGRKEQHHTAGKAGWSASVVRERSAASLPSCTLNDCCDVRIGSALPFAI